MFSQKNKEICSKDDDDDEVVKYCTARRALNPRFDVPLVHTDTHAHTRTHNEPRHRTNNSINKITKKILMFF